MIYPGTKRISVGGGAVSYRKNNYNFWVADAYYKMSKIIGEYLIKQKDL